MKGTAGDPHLGGVYFTKQMIDSTVIDIQRKMKDWQPNEKSIHILRDACEIAKLTLATEERAKINAKSLLSSQNEPFNHSKLITRGQFDRMNEDLFEKALKKVDEAIESVPKLTIDHIDDVILVGGSTRILKIQNMLAEKLPSSRILKDIDPDLAGECTCLSFCCCNCSDGICSCRNVHCTFQKKIELTN